jgi:hypothetical protein
MPPTEQCWPSSGHDTPYQISSIHVCNRTADDDLHNAFCGAVIAAIREIQERRAEVEREGEDEDEEEDEDA